MGWSQTSGNSYLRVLTKLASSLGASLLGIADAAGKFVSTTVEAALLELRLNQSVNVLDYGAVADGVALTDGSMTAASTTLTAPSGNFTAADIGKGVAVFDAGAGTLSLFSTITSINSPTSVELADAASVTVAGVPVQYGTDCGAAFHAAIDAIHAAGGGTLKADGKFFHAAKLQLRADQITYDFRRFVSYGQNVSILDDVTTTHQVTDVVGYGGTFEVIGDSGSIISPPDPVPYNPLAIVHAKNVYWYGPISRPRGGARGLSIQANGVHGTAPYENLININVIDIDIQGDGTPHDGVDITSSTDGQNMIQDVVVTGKVSGCQRGIAAAAGSTAKYHTNINVDLIVDGATDTAATCSLSKQSSYKVVAINCEKEGVVFSRNENSSGDFKIHGIGTGLGVALQTTDNGADTVNTVSAEITHDGANKWTKAVNPQLHDCSYPKLSIDGATTGLDTQGFRSCWGAVTVRNCTTPISNKARAEDQWQGKVIDFGAGANPKVIMSGDNKTDVNGDASATLTVGSSNPNQRWTTALTAARDADLQTADAYEGAEFLLVRSAGGGFNLVVKQDGGGALKNMAAGTWSRWTFNAGNWFESSYGNL